MRLGAIFWSPLSHSNQFFEAPFPTLTNKFSDLFFLWSIGFFGEEREVNNRQFTYWNDCTLFIEDMCPENPSIFFDCEQRPRRSSRVKNFLHCSSTLEFETKTYQIHRNRFWVSGFENEFRFSIWLRFEPRIRIFYLSKRPNCLCWKNCTKYQNRNWSHSSNTVQIKSHLLIFYWRFWKHVDHGPYPRTFMSGDVVSPVDVREGDGNKTTVPIRFKHFLCKSKRRNKMLEKTQGTLHSAETND